MCFCLWNHLISMLLLPIPILPLLLYLVVCMLKCVLNLVVVSGGHELSSYYSQDDDRGAMRAIKDSDSIGASYDRYLSSTALN